MTARRSPASGRNSKTGRDEARTSPTRGVRETGALQPGERGAAAEGPDWWRMLVDSLPGAVYTTDPDGRITYFNTAAEALWGRAPALGELWCGSYRLYDPATGARIPLEQCPMAVCVRERRSVRGVPVLVERQDGTRRTVLPHPDPIFDGAGRYLGSRNVLVDITPLAEAQSARAAEHERVRRVIDANPECVMVLAPDSSLTELNPAGVRLFEVEDAAEVLGRAVHEFIDPEHLETFKGLQQRALYGESGAGEVGVVGRRGGRRWLDVRTAPIRRGGEAGEVTAVLYITRDIGERRERDLISQRLAAIVENSDDAIISKDLKGMITSWNAAAGRMFGWSAEEMVGRSILAIIPDERRSEEDLILGRIRAGGRVDHFETERRTKSGARIMVSVTVSPIRDAHGRVVGASKIARDITEQVRIKEVLAHHTEMLTLAVAQTQRELIESHEALRRSERLAALGTMAAGLGHDIGNLLLPLRAGIDVVRERAGADAEVESACITMARCADVFASLVRGLRLFGRGESDDQLGDMVDVAGWSRDALPLLRTLAGRGVEVTFSTEPDLPPLGMGAGSLTQAVANLVKNSADALGSMPGPSRPGRIDIRAAREGGGGQVRIEVQDNGPGMTPEVLRHCMEPFYTTRVRGRRSGSGLGLALVHRVVEESKGKVSIDSAPGMGTTVRLSIPPARASGPRPVAARAQVRLRAPALRALASRILRAGGFDAHMLDSREPLDPGAPLWVADSLGEQELAGRAPGLPVILLSDAPLGGAGGAQVCRIGARPSATEFMQCLKSVRHDG